MIKRALNNKTYTLVLLILIIGGIYGAGRLYYQLTGGFVVSNTYYATPFDKRFEITLPDIEKIQEIERVLNQPFNYLGKGCQSYVFASADGRYVIKFFKYQRFKPQEWLSYFSFIPGVESYRQKKIDYKRKKLDGVLNSWKISYEALQNETGIIYVHLNKHKRFNQPLVIYDKMGFERSIDLNRTEFLIQKRAEMLCPHLNELMENHRQDSAENILTELINMLVLEYSKGYADNDHALMQNTGVINNHPVHIDVGQFIKNSIVQNPKVFHQEIFNKTYKFKKWLEKHHPSLAKHLESRLIEIMGENYYSMKPIFYTADMARIPNEGM